MPERRLRAPTIFAMGGGGFTMEPDNAALDDYVLGLAAAAGSARPRICLLPTAGGDAEDQICRFYATFGDRHCEPSHISLFRLGAHPVPLRERLLAQDAIYVGGGSMVNLLAIWRAQGLDAVLREAWQAGVALAGISAGAMCWFEAGITTGTGAPAPSSGLGFLPGSFSVHHDGEPERRPVFLATVASGAIGAGYAADDGAGLLFRGARLVEVVASRPHARAYRVARAPTGGVVEDPLETRFLATPPADVTGAAPFAVAELRRLRGARRSGARAGVRRSFGRD